MELPYQVNKSKIGNKIKPPCGQTVILLFYNLIKVFKINDFKPVMKSVICFFRCHRMTPIFNSFTGESPRAEALNTKNVSG